VEIAIVIDSSIPHHHLIFITVGGFPNVKKSAIFLFLFVRNTSCNQIIKIWKKIFNFSAKLCAKWARNVI
jgi:hypothetical protein